MNGSNSIIKVGTYEKDKTIGSTKGKFKFLKNSISSNKFNITPKARKIKTVFRIILENFPIKYLFIILFISLFFLFLFF